MKSIQKNKGAKNEQMIFFEKAFVFRKEDRINRLERDLTDEKRKAEKLLENMVTSFFFFLFHRPISSSSRIRSSNNVTVKSNPLRLNFKVKWIRCKVKSPHSRVE